MQRKSFLTRVLPSLILLIAAALLPATGLAKDKTWKFVVLSDTRSNPCDGDWKGGVNSETLARIAAAVAREKPDLVLVPGDLVLGRTWRECGQPDPFNTQLRNWRAAMDPVYAARIPVLPTRGNHELLSKDHFPDEPCHTLTPDPAALSTWLAVFGNDVPQNGPAGQKGLTYAYPHKNAIFIALDELTDHLSYDPSWLDAMLKKYKRRHLFLFGHYPAFGVMHRDNLSCNEAGRDNLWKTMDANNGRLYFCGHDHLYDRIAVTGPAGNHIRQVLTGNGGAPFYNYSGGYQDKRVKPEKRVLSKPGYVVLTVKGPRVTAKMKTLTADGVTISDEFGYTLSR
jgi:3',5'-cyclic AMP phosphodiesterase CpdA